MRREREYQSHYRELADHGEFRRVSEVLDQERHRADRVDPRPGRRAGQPAVGFGQACSDLRITEHEVIGDGDAMVIWGWTAVLILDLWMGSCVPLPR